MYRSLNVIKLEMLELRDKPEIQISHKGLISLVSHKDVYYLTQLYSSYTRISITISVPWAY